jgi:hypothetical protein
MDKVKSYFEELNSIDLKGKIEKKNGLSYVSWAYAWGELKKRFPASYYTIYEDVNGMFYHTDGKTCWVKTGVTVVMGDAIGDVDFALEHIEYLPVMNYKNKSIPKEEITSFDVNTAIQRSLTKAVARHGIGLYVYAGEDLPCQDEPEATSNKGHGESIVEKIRACKTESELSKLYNDNKKLICSNKDLLEQVSIKGKELKNK